MFKFIAFLLTSELLVIPTFSLSTIDHLVQEEENCETLQTDIHITKDEEFEGRLIRTCSADISVTKCEGYCNSRVQPSVMSSTGFFKECYCCRESYLRKRSIILNECYNADGIKLTGEKGYMEITLDEPAECRCIKCSDFSR